MARKYCIGVLALAAMLVLMVCAVQPVFADEEPVKIGSYDDLKAFIDEVNSGAAVDKDAVLTSDIRVPSNVKNDWVPLGKDAEHAYQGRFDGNEYRIIGINIDRRNEYPAKWSKGEKVNNFTAFCSFLGKEGAIVDLTINATIVDVNEVAGLVSQNQGLISNCNFKGYLESNVYPNGDAEGGLLVEDGKLVSALSESGGIAAVNMGKIRICETLEGSKIRRGGQYVGGIVGNQADGGSIFGCANQAYITATETKYPVTTTFVGYIGGICGLQEALDTVTKESRPAITLCENHGRIECLQLGGGICGGSYSGDILACANYGVIDIENNWAGGIVADFSSGHVMPEDKPSELSYCENYGEINPQKADEKTGMFHGSYVSGVAGVVEDGVSWMPPLKYYVRVHHNINYGPVTGKYEVGGVIGGIANGETEDKGTLVYELVNLGHVTGNDRVGGVAGDCPGILSDSLNYGKVTMITAGYDDEGYFAGGISSCVDSTGCVTTSLNAGSVTALYPDNTRNDGSDVFIGGVLGAAAAESQFKGNYYVAESSGAVICLVGNWPEITDGMVKLSDAGGEAAKISMPALFDGTTTRHAPSDWHTVENEVKDKTTYYMTPQLSGFLEDVSLESILEAEAEISYPADIMYANVSIPGLTYTGQPQQPEIAVNLGGIVIDPSNYTVTKEDSYTDAGTYNVIIKAEGDTYSGYTAGSFEIVKAAQKITVKPVKKTIKAGKSYTLKSTVTPAIGHGKVTYKKKSGSKKITISKTGKVTVKKGLKKGTYKIKVIVSAAGNENCKAASKTQTLTIKVK